METVSKRERLKEKIQAHLRKTARHLVKLDKLDETLHYLLESFWMEFTCDFVAILLRENHQLIAKAYKGESPRFAGHFPLSVEECAPHLLQEAFWWSHERLKREDECKFFQILEQENLSTWFTVPLKDEQVNFGVCVIGFHHFVPLLLEAEKFFVEFGKDVAVAIELIRNREVTEKKMQGIEWIRENLYPGFSLEQLVEKIVERAGKGTQARSAAVYLYDETIACFVYQPPAYGYLHGPGRIQEEAGGSLRACFPFLETPGGHALTVPLNDHFKTIGVIHVAEKATGTFTNEDLELLQFLASHVSTLIENARFYHNEVEGKRRLQTLVHHHQELVKQTVEGESFDEMTRTLRALVDRSVILFDRFLRPISHCLREEEEPILPDILAQARSHQRYIKHAHRREVWLQKEDGREWGMWPVMGGGDLLGYLSVAICREEMDEFLRLTIDHARNVYAIQFIKQKLVMETKEQVKDSFIHQLLTDPVEDRKKILQYAYLVHWDLYTPHRVGVLWLRLGEEHETDGDLLGLEAGRTDLWDRVKQQLSHSEPEIILSRKGEEFILIAPVSKEKQGVKRFWQHIYRQIQSVVAQEHADCTVYLGIGGQTENIEGYPFSYRQAVQACNVVSLRFRETGFALFEELGAYTLLHHLPDVSVVELFIRNYLSPLLHYSDGKGANLFQTLRVYLNHNGNLKETADALFIHRSTLQYRLEKIQELLALDLNDAENRFTLMMAYKLYDLYHPFLLKSAEKNA
jgi:purine catabolism regulator